MKQLSVCFVCLGNICRSPTAEGVFRELVKSAGLESEIHIDSAGTAAYHVGERADRRATAVARQRGVELTSRARRFEAEDFERFDYVLAMDANNLADLRALRAVAGESPAQLCLFRDFDAEAPAGSEVPDPYYGGDQGFEDVLDMCERACSGLLAAIRQKHLTK